VRALVRPQSRLRELDGVEPVPGDLRDAESLERAIQGCGQVYHIAADYRLWAPDPREMYRSNVDGTRNLLSAAQRAGVERIVYTSTVGCIGIPPGAEGTEETAVRIDEMSGPYKRSKYLAEEVALGFARQGLPVVIVNPTAPVGDHDVRPTPTGRIIVDFARGGLPAFVDTGLNLVDVRDVALGHLQAAEKGRIGERYILGGENLTLSQILERLSPMANRPAPKTQIPYAVAYAFGALSTAWASVTGKEPRAPLDGVRMAKKKMFASHAKASRELGYRPGPVDDALRRAFEWFRDNGYLAR
jgi:dihydroflavonol-4-reductase